MRNPGRVLTKTMILSHVWGYNFNPGTNVVDVLVSRLREKIDRDFEPKLLHTVRGVGYVLKEPDAVSDARAPDRAGSGSASRGRTIGRGFGLRLALWYAAVFVASSLAIVLLTYTLLASSLAERDRQIVVSTLREYSERYASGGLPRARARGRHRAALRPPRTALRARRPRRRRDAVRQHAAGVGRLRRQQARRAQRPVGAGAVGLARRARSKSRRRGSSTARCSRSARAPRAARSCWRGSAPSSRSSRSPSSRRPRRRHSSSRARRCGRFTG